MKVAGRPAVSGEISGGRGSDGAGDDFSGDMGPRLPKLTFLGTPRLPPHLWQPTGDEGRIAVQNHNAYGEFARDLPTVPSIQFLSFNTLAFADLEEADDSGGSSIASTVQQMSISFGVAIASLATIVLLGGNRHPDPARMVWGIHRTFLALGLFTIGASWVFSALRAEDGASVSGVR